MTDDPLAFPKITAETTPDSSSIQLRITGSAPETIDEGTTEASMREVIQRVQHVAHTLGRPVRLTATSPEETTTLIVSPAGEVTHEATTSTARPPCWRRPVVLIPTAAVLIAAVAGGGLTVHHVLTTEPPTPTATATTPAGPIHTETAPSSAATPMLSADGKSLAFSTADGFIIADADTGKTRNKIDLSDLAQENPSWTGAIRPNGTDGFLFTWNGTHARFWNDGKLTDETSYPAASIPVTRGNQTFLFSKESGATADSIRELTIGTKRWTRPAQGSAFLGLTADDSAAWASTHDGGTILTATDAGKQQESHKLAKPTADAKLSRWIGLTSTGDVLAQWETGKTSNVTIQPATSDDITHTITVADSQAKPVLSLDATVVLIGGQLIDTATGETHDVGTLEDPTPTATGFTGTINGTRVFIDARGAHTSPDDRRIIGITHDGGTVIADEDQITITPKGTQK